jgi:hypothetical protein
MDRERRRAAALGGLITGSVLLFGPGAGGAADTGPQLQAIGRSVQDVDLRWTPATAGGCGTTIWRDGAPLATLCGSASTFIDTAVEPGTRYRYQVVTATSGAGPAVSNEVTLTTPSLPEGLDVTPPSRATDLQALASDAGVLLSWQSASDDTDVSAYEVRRDGLAIALVDAATLEFLDAPRPPGSQVTYSVTAFDVLGQASQPTLVIVDLAGAPPPTSGSAAAVAGAPKSS